MASLQVNAKNRWQPNDPVHDKLTDKRMYLH